MSINNDLTEEEYRIKYLKYKEKYTTLKNQSSGGITASCFVAYTQAGWGIAPCTVCAKSTNLATRCCRGFKQASSSSVWSAMKGSVKRGKKVNDADVMCVCGHWASLHNPDATRESTQISLNPILDAIANNTGKSKADLKAVNKTTVKTLDPQARLAEIRNRSSTTNIVYPPVPTNIPSSSTHNLSEAEQIAEDEKRLAGLAL